MKDKIKTVKIKGKKDIEKIISLQEKLLKIQRDKKSKEYFKKYRREISKYHLARSCTKITMEDVISKLLRNGKIKDLGIMTETVKITNGKYKDCIVDVFYKGLHPYFKDDELDVDVYLCDYTYIKN